MRDNQPHYFPLQLSIEAFTIVNSQKLRFYHFKDGSTPFLQVVFYGIMSFLYIIFVDIFERKLKIIRIFDVLETIQININCLQILSKFYTRCKLS